MTPHRRRQQTVDTVDNGSEAKEDIVVVFGGTGFLGRRVVRHLRAHDVSVRVASRIRTGVTTCLVEMIRNFDRSVLTFTTSGRWPTHFSALTVW